MFAGAFCKAILERSFRFLRQHTSVIIHSSVTVVNPSSWGNVVTSPESFLKFNLQLLFFSSGIFRTSTRTELQLERSANLCLFSCRCSSVTCASWDGCFWRFSRCRILRKHVKLVAFVSEVGFLSERPGEQRSCVGIPKTA